MTSASCIAADAPNAAAAAAGRLPVAARAGAKKSRRRKRCTGRFHRRPQKSLSPWSNGRLVVKRGGWWSNGRLEVKRPVDHPMAV